MLQQLAHEVVALDVVQQCEKSAIHIQVLTIQEVNDLRVACNDLVLEGLVLLKLRESSVEDCGGVCDSRAVIGDGVNCLKHVERIRVQPIVSRCQLIDSHSG